MKRKRTWAQNAIDNVSLQILCGVLLLLLVFFREYWELLAYDVMWFCIYEWTFIFKNVKKNHENSSIKFVKASNEEQISWQNQFPPSIYQSLLMSRFPMSFTARNHKNFSNWFVSHEKTTTKSNENRKSEANLREFFFWLASERVATALERKLKWNRREIVENL